jgi:DNA-binding PadR family transcriptional regulator
VLADQGREHRVAAEEEAARARVVCGSHSPGIILNVFVRAQAFAVCVRYLCSILTVPMAKGLSFTTVTVLHSVAGGSGYGFEIIDATGLPSGTVYPALARLERDGYLRSEWEDAAVARGEKRPPRRYYRATAAGVRVLSAELARYRALKPITTPVSARSRG